MLIYDFVTLPITRDVGLIKKIFAMLRDQSLQLYRGEVYQHEGLIAETHFCKLSLMAKLYIRACGDQVPGQPALSYKKFPLKFDSDCQSLLKECFDQELLSSLESHWV